jgi:hypothetical protein
MQHELYYADLHLVAAVTQAALESWQHVNYDAVLYLVAAETQAALESWQHVNYDAVLDFVVVSASFDVVVELLFVF